MNTKERKGIIAKMIVDDPFSKGSGACAGCGSQLALKHLLHILINIKKKIVILVCPAGCWIINIGRYPNFIGQDKFSTVLALFASAAPEATGIADAMRLKKRDDVIVVAFCGDGATYDIGFGALSAAADRNDNILYVLNDNEAYMNTGVQRSGSTPLGAWTTTTPDGAERSISMKKDIDRIMAAHEIPYLATATIGSSKGSLQISDDFYKKVGKAADIEGFRFLHLFNPCPIGWKSETSDTTEISELAVKTKIFPLVEYEEEKWRITYRPKQILPVSEYFRLQGRFQGLMDDNEMLVEIQKIVDKRFKSFEKLGSDSINKQPDQDERRD